MVFLLRTIVRYALRLLLGFVCFVLLYLFASWALPYVKVNGDYAAPASGMTIFVESNGVHTDFLLPVKSMQKDWTAMFPYRDFEAVDSSYHYISIGWGDKGFFLNTPSWSDLTFSTAFKASFGLSSTAMHITYQHEPKQDSMCRALTITPQQYDTLIAYINHSFLQQDGNIVQIHHPGYNKQDCFYEANGTYSLFKTCNIWTNNGLKVMGVKTGMWTPFQGGIMKQLN